MTLNFVLLVALLSLHAHSAPTFDVTNADIRRQAPLQTTLNRPRKLRGRFLQITDIHPDPYYTPKTSESTACHRKKPKKGEQSAGWWGTMHSECDSPFSLTNFTLNYLEANWADEIDFVIWTGDNARHDNDNKLPRTPAEIYGLNRVIAKRMYEIFSTRGIAVVPSLGNNDVWPHNILTAGPNSITTEFSSIWKEFVPFPSFQVFQRGAYFSVEVIPDQVAVVSLNTMYFYDSNKAVGGCEYKERDDPGNLELDWLEVQLKQYRERNMQVWLSGHVPPSPGNYFPECYVRYVELSLRFQDTILGHLFGHMNADHFRFLEAEDLQLVLKDAVPASKPDNELYDSLIEDFEALPSSAKKTNLDEYAVVNTSPPIVPNPYLPTFRIFAYNVTDHERAWQYGKRKHGHHRGRHGDKDKHCKREPYRDSWKCVLDEPWHSDPESPSRMNRLWTPLGYAQYYIPHLEKATKKHIPKVKLEYVTFQFSDLHGINGNDTIEDVNYRRPIPLHLLPQSLQNTTDPDQKGRKKYCSYELADLTVGSWVGLARRLAGDGKHSEKLRKRFRKYMYLE